MTRSKRIGSLAGVAGLKANEAARRLAVCLADVTAKERGLEQLRAYMDEYGQLTRSNGPALDSRRLHNARLFIGRLGEAVAQQEHDLERAIARYEQEARAFKEAHRHQKAMERLFEQYYREERQASERREQAEMDELILGLGH